MVWLVWLVWVVVVLYLCLFVCVFVGGFCLFVFLCVFFFFGGGVWGKGYLFFKFIFLPGCGMHPPSPTHYFAFQIFIHLTTIFDLDKKKCSDSVSCH